MGVCRPMRLITLALLSIRDTIAEDLLRSDAGLCSECQGSRFKIECMNRMPVH